MLSRRNIRIKVLQQLYAFQQQESPSLPNTIKQLQSSFKGIYQVYYFAIEFLEDFNTYLESEREIELQKYFPSKTHIHKTKAIERLDFYQSLIKSEDFKLYKVQSKYNWRNHGNLFDKLFEDIVQYDFFIEYDIFETPSADIQKQFLTNLYEVIFNEFELFESIMSDEYILWDDDSADVLQAIIKSIDKFYDKGKLSIEKPEPKQTEGMIFGEDLLKKCIVDKEYIDDLIKNNISNWDSERLTIMDIIMLRMALSEFLYFESIPPKATINEYLDIAKIYSTPKSHIFINGVLDKIRKTLIDNGKMIKTGIGLKNEK
jgi:transcription antitermination protein NusB